MLYLLTLLKSTSVCQTQILYLFETPYGNMIYLKKKLGKNLDNLCLLMFKQKESNELCDDS